MNFSWFFFKWSLLAGVIGAAVALAQWYQRMDEEVRRRVEARFAAHYHGLNVSLQSAQLVRDQGILIRGLSITEPGADGPGGELLHVDEAFFTCKTDLERLIKGEPDITAVLIRRPMLHATRRSDGTWSSARLLPPPTIGDEPPEVRIEDATVDLFDPTRVPASTLVLRDVNFLVHPPAKPAGTAGARTADTGTGSHDAVPPAVERIRRFEGSFAGDLFKQVDVSGQLDPERMELNVGGQIEGLDISPELAAALPASWSGWMDAIGNLRSQGSASFRVSYDPAFPVACRFDVNGQLVRGRYDDPRLPHPLTELHAKVVFNNDGITIRDLEARSAQATLRLSGRRAGFAAESPMAIHGEIRDLELDQRLIGVLPDVLRKEWQRYLPTGQIHAEIDLNYDGHRWKPDISARCSNVSFAHEKFPYRVEHVQGRLDLKDDHLRADLTGYGGTQPIRISAEMNDIFSVAHGWVESRGEGLPIDDKLTSAMPETTRVVIRSLAPQGKLDFTTRLWRERGEETIHRHLVVQVSRGSIRYERFPYPVHEITGTLEMSDGDWKFRDLQGVNGAGRIRCEGAIRPAPQGNELFLRFTGNGVALEEELHKALPHAMQQIWSDMRPQGVIDLVTDVSYLTGQEKLSVTLQAQPRSETSSIQPVYFPYRLEHLGGTLLYRDGQVTLEQFHGEHGNTRVSALGVCQFLPDGSWRFQFRDLSVDRLRIDREFTSALPARLKKVASDLNPSGPLNIHGGVSMARGPNPGDPLTADWDLGIGFHQGSLECGVRLDNLNGEVRLVGGYNGQQHASRGELAIDSVCYKDHQFTQVTGPIWIDDQRVLLGSWVDRPTPGPPADAGSPPRSPRPIVARLFGGTVAGDGWIALSPQPRFNLNATLEGADLAALAREAATGPQRLRGKIYASVELRGNGRSLNALGGRGAIQLRDSDIYELPLMISLLKILSIREPNRKAFSTSDIDFRVEGGHVYFNRITFSGDAISLIGNGEMNFQSDIRLTFHSMVGRADRHLPVLHDVLGGASQQIMLLHVGGTLQNPEVSREAFPGVNQALQQFQADWQRNLGSSPQEANSTGPPMDGKLPKRQ